LITHVVLFKLRNKEEIGNVREMLDGLRDKVPVIRSLETGVDVLRSERSYDIALTVEFDSIDDLDRYQRHPEHVKAADCIALLRESVVVVDYES